MSMSDYLEGQIRAHVFRTASFTKPTQLWIALYTSDPTDADTGTEVSGGSYARVQLNPADANWAAGTTTNGQTSNSSAITFPAPTANWGVITHVGIRDAAAAGNLLVSGALTTAKTVNNGDAAPSFAINALTVTFD